VLKDDTFRRVLRARDVIHARPSQPLRLDDLAREAALSRFHFLRVFRDAFGETPHRCLQRVRLEQAKRMLEREEANVTEVCFEVGFESLGSFSALFARRYGVPPRAYRKRVWALGAEKARIYIPCCFLR
jgi:AraC-like DNA-binding protein